MKRTMFETEGLITSEKLRLSRQKLAEELAEIDKLSSRELLARLKKLGAPGIVQEPNLARGGKPCKQASGSKAD